MPTYTQTANGKNHIWLKDEFRFTNYNNLYSCVRDETQLKRVIDSMLIDIRAGYNFKLGEKASQTAVQEHRTFVQTLADDLNPKLQSYFSLGLGLHRCFNRIPTFAANQAIQIKTLPTLKKMLH